MAAQGESKSSEKIIPTSAVGTLGFRWDMMGHLDIIECKGGEYLRELSPSSQVVIEITNHSMGTPESGVGKDVSKSTCVLLYFNIVVVSFFSDKSQRCWGS